METYEDDDDTHFCIKCHSTVTGLENYVRHRQTGCCRSSDKSTHDIPVTPTTVSYPEILNADAFFNSLELQSSAKKTPRLNTVQHERNRKPGKQETRKRNRKTDAEDNNVKASPPDKLHNMLPVVTDLDNPTDHLGIPSLVGFPDIVTSTSKPSTSTPSKLCTPSIHTLKIETSSYHHKHDPVPENSLESLMVGGSHSKQVDPKQGSQPIDQVWLGDTILTDLVKSGDRAHSSFSRYIDYEYHQEEDTDVDSSEEEIGDEDSYSESDEDREYPPCSHTGGKWKPGLEAITQVVAELGEDDGEPEEEHSEHPPPSHTGGKWKPADNSQSQKVEEYESKEAGTQPPPGHTRGKWIPGARAGYWCSPCGRRLASRLVYKRHLLSDLHARRSIRELDGVLRLPREVEPFLQRKNRTLRQRIALWKSEEVEEWKETAGKCRLRKREKEVLHCEMCHARVRRLQMGKHLLSHYHCRVAGATPCGPKARRFLLDNMANVVRQCPFQCSACRFYCNTEETFLIHWRSDFHDQIHQQIEGSYRCMPCDFRCEDGDEMEAHLTSSSHREAVSVMNGSVPVVIRRQRSLTCGSCGQPFRYNLQLWLHARETGHDASTASDDYQQRITCSLCPQVLRSLISLQRHQLACHFVETQENVACESQSGPYFCSFCSLNFTTAREAVLHRRTSRHKEMVRVRKSGEGSSGSIQRECLHCGETQPGLAELKEHILQNHPQLCHKCPRCGMVFPLPQDVTRHTREDDCLGKERISDVVEGSDADWQCARCTFTTNSQAEYMFHEALHAGCSELVETAEGDDSNRCKILHRYQCPVCRKLLTKTSLRDHIRGHTGERPFPCPKCNASFSRRSALNTHQKKECTAVSSGQVSETPGRQRSYSCAECDYAFYTKHALRRHMLRHAGKQHKCGLPGCPTVLRDASELRVHRMLVHESTSVESSHQCPHCAYAAKTKSRLRRHQQIHEEVPEGDDSGLHRCPYEGCQFKSKLTSHLRRHFRRHTGAKPYKCPHCAYASRNLENLRKHVLSTNLHPGKTIYECSFCDAFSTNFAKELRAHLLDAHAEMFPTPMHASSHVTNIYDPECDSSHQAENPLHTV